MAEDRSQGEPTDDELLDHLIDEWLQIVRGGGIPDLSAYTAKYPEQDSLIREVFPTVVAIEKSKETSVLNSTEKLHGPICEYPSKMGDFELIKEIGRGGMGVVFEARQISLNRAVCVKILSKHLSKNLGLVRRFEREALSAARLQHPNIVSVFGNGFHEGYHYYAMQLIQGESLDRMLLYVRNLRCMRGKGDGIDSHSDKSEMPAETWIDSPLRDDSKDDALKRFWSETPSGENSGGHGVECTNWGLAWANRSETSKEFYHSAARLIKQAADAVAYAHLQGVVHRDIKPANLLIDASGNCWITDFGLAKLDSAVDLTNTGDIVGTLRYIAPEQLDGVASSSCDIYGLGITLYELLVLRPAFDGRNHATLIAQVKEGRPIRPRDLQVSIPKDLETIILKAIEKDPQHRYRTAGALADDLGRFLEDLPLKAKPPSSIESIIRWTRRRKTTAMTLFLTIFIMFVVLPTIVVVYTFLLREEVRHTREANAEKTEAEKRAKIQLAKSLIEQARWLSMSGSPTRRTDSLDALQRANLVLEEMSPRSSEIDELFVELTSQACSAISLPSIDVSFSIGSEALDPSREALVAVSAKYYVVVDRTAHESKKIRVKEIGTNKDIRVWDVPTYQTMLSSDSNYLITQSNYANRRSVLTVRDIANGQEVWQAKILHNCLAIDHESRGIIALDENGRSLVYDLKERKLLPSLYVHQRELPYALQACWEDRQIAILDGESVSIWDVETNRCQEVIHCSLKGSKFESFCFSPAGNWIAIRRSDGRVCIFDAASGKEVQSFSADTLGGILLESSPSGDMLAYKSWGSKLTLWDVRAAGEVCRFSLPIQIDFVSLAAERLGPIPSANRLSFWRIEPSRAFRSHVISLDPSIRIARMSIANHGRLLALSSLFDKELRFLDLETGLSQTIDGRWRNLVFSSDHFWGVDDGVLNRWNLTQSPTGWRLSGRQRILKTLNEVHAVNNAGDRLASNLHGGVTSRVLTEDLESPQVCKNYGDVRELHYSPDNRWLVGAGHNERGCTVFELGTSNSWNLVPEHYLTIPEFSPDNRYLAIQIPAEGLRVYEVGKWDTPRFVWRETLGKPAFSPDGRFLATSFAPGVITILDLNYEKAILRLHHPDAFTLFDLKFTRDGQKIAFFSAESTCVSSWNIYDIFQELDELGLNSDHLQDLRKMTLSHRGAPNTSQQGKENARLGRDSPTKIVEFERDPTEILRLKRKSTSLGWASLFGIRNELEEAYASDPEDPWVNSMLAWEICKSRRNSDGQLPRVASMIDAIRKWHSSPDYHHYYEYMLAYRLGDWKESQRLYHKHRDRWPASSQAYFDYTASVVHAKLGSLEQGFGIWRRAAMSQLKNFAADLDLWRMFLETGWDLLEESRRAFLK